VLPRIVIHSAVSINGYLDGFAADLGAYYGLIAHWHEDATLVGAGAVLRATQDEPVDAAPVGSPDDREASDCIALVSHQTPRAALFALDGAAADQAIRARLDSAEQLDGGLVWLRYSA
jgi:hypothetical protein